MEGDSPLLQIIGWAMVLVATTSIILTALSTYCAWTSRMKSRTLIDYFIVFYNILLLQTAIFSQILTLVRIATWKNNNIVKPWLCLIIYLSSFCGAAAVEVSLTVITILRFLFVFYPSYGLWIMQHEKKLRIWLSFAVICTLISRVLTTFYLSRKNLYYICIDAETLEGGIFHQSGVMLFLVYFSLSYGVDIFLMLKLWLKQRKRYRQVGILNLNSINARRQQNLLTFSGNALSRLFMLLTYILLSFLYGFINKEDPVYNSRLFFGLTYLIYFTIFTVVVPLVQFFTSPLLRLVLFSAYKKIRKILSKEALHPSAKQAGPNIFTVS